MREDCGPVLIVDDDAGFRGLVVTLLASAGMRTVEAGTGEQALAAARRNRPALAVLDVVLPDTNGYELCHKFREEFGEELPLLLMSAYRVDAIDRSAGLLIGGDDYVTKPFDPDELVARVRRLVARSRRYPATNGREHGQDELTTREREVLQLLAEGRRPAEIADGLVISPKTVSSHIQRVLGKLNVHSRTEAVAAAYREGLVEAPWVTSGS